MLSFLQPKRNRRALALLLAAVLVLSPLSALAGTYEIENGSITVSNDGSGQTVTQAGKYDNEPDAKPVITNRDPDTPSTNTVTLNAGAGATVEVTIQDLHIDNSGDPDYEYDGGASFTTTGDVVIELDGDNTLTAGLHHAGLQKENGGTLTIQDENETAGSLTANGGEEGAGIGGGYKGDGTNITVSSGTVTAQGGNYGAGIGGGGFGNGTDITIEDGTVTATGGVGGAGIGGGDGRDGADITISGDAQVTATGGVGGAGIGGGGYGSGTDINITGGTVVATGGSHAAGIGAGGGSKIVGSDITISGGTVVAVSTEVGAGIGGGSAGTAGDITVSGDAQVSVAGGETYITNDYTRGPGAGIGDGGEQTNAAADPIPGQEAAPNTDDLTKGHIDYYEAGTTAEQIQNKEATPTKTICGSQAHVAGTPQKENEVAGSCTVEGGYDMVTYCTRCGAKIATEHTNTGKVHSPGTPQKENVVTGSCTVEGGYDLVTYLPPVNQDGRPFLGASEDINTLRTYAL